MIIVAVELFYSCTIFGYYYKWKKKTFRLMKYMWYVNVLNFTMEIRNGLVVINTFLKEQILSIHSIGHK